MPFRHGMLLPLRVSPCYFSAACCSPPRHYFSPCHTARHAAIDAAFDNTMLSPIVAAADFHDAILIMSIRHCLILRRVFHCVIILSRRLR